MREELEVKNEAGAKCGKSVQERRVMLQSLTKSDIEKFEFVAKTPAGGMAYYCNKQDIAAINYRDSSKIFYDRKTEHGICAAAFNKSITINRT